MVKPTIGILAIQGDAAEHQRALSACGVDSISIRKSEELAGIDGLVIPGGESTAMSKLIEVSGLLEPLQNLVTDRLPMFGSCAGMIMLASALTDGRPDQHVLGAIDMTVRRNAFGRQVDSFETDIDMPVVGVEPVRGVFIRAPWVEKVADDVDVLASVEHESGGNRIVAVRQGNSVAISFHPELTGDNRVHQYFIDIVRENS